MTNEYIYMDGSKKDRPTLFVCEANDILEADKQFTRIMGKIPALNPHIVCDVMFNQSSPHAGERINRV